MKKLIILVVVGFMIFLAGCNFNPITTVSTTSSDTASTTSTTTITSTTISDTASTTSSNSQEEVLLSLNSGQDTVEINSNWINAGAKLIASDIEYEMQTTNTVDITTLGTYAIVYTLIYNDQTYSITRYVMVSDQIAPTLQLNLGIDTVNVGEEWVDTGATVLDNSLEDVTIITNGVVDTSTAGTYQIIYSVEDSSGNTNSIIRYVTVIE